LTVGAEDLVPDLLIVPAVAAVVRPKILVANPLVRPRIALVIAPERLIPDLLALPRIPIRPGAIDVLCADQGRNTAKGERDEKLLHVGWVRFEPACCTGAVVPDLQSRQADFAPKAITRPFAQM
jgi:hypothetical protein